MYKSTLDTLNVYQDSLLFRNSIIDNELKVGYEMSLQIMKENSKKILDFFLESSAYAIN